MEWSFKYDFQEVEIVPNPERWIFIAEKMKERSKQENKLEQNHRYKK